MAIYPGNPEVIFEEKNGATSTHTLMSFGTHTGTHIDAPKHVFKDGESIDLLDLNMFYGPARVLDLSSIKEKITIADVEKYSIQKGERILFKTSNSQRGFETFYTDYVYLDGDLADYLAQKEIQLCGIDYFSIKQKGGMDNRPHTSLLKAGIPIIEGINLSAVQEGMYTLIAFPLKLNGLDGSPARIVLVKEG